MANQEQTVAYQANENRQQHSCDPCFCFRAIGGWIVRLAKAWYADVPQRLALQAAAAVGITTTIILATAAINSEFSTPSWMVVSAIVVLEANIGSQLFKGHVLESSRSCYSCIG